MLLNIVMSHWSSIEHSTLDRYSSDLRVSSVDHKIEHL